MVSLTSARNLLQRYAPFHACFRSKDMVYCGLLRCTCLLLTQSGHRRVRFNVISRLVGRPCLTILLMQLTIVLTQCPPA